MVAKEDYLSRSDILFLACSRDALVPLLSGSRTWASSYADTASSYLTRQVWKSGRGKVRDIDRERKREREGRKKYRGRRRQSMRRREWERVYIDSKIQNESECKLLNNDKAKTNHQIAEEERGTHGGRYQIEDIQRRKLIHS